MTFVRETSKQSAARFLRSYGHAMQPVRARAGVAIARGQGRLRHRMAIDATRSQRCECGNTKEALAVACTRCGFLDEPVPTECGFRIVDALRNERFLTLQELAGEVEISTRNTLRTLNQLRSIGRVDVVVEEFESVRPGLPGFAAYWARRRGEQPTGHQEHIVVFERNLWFLTDRGASRRSS